MGFFTPCRSSLVPSFQALVVVAVILVSGPPAGADHPHTALPITLEDERMTEAVDLAEQDVEGYILECTKGTDDVRHGNCVNQGSWYSIGIASLGLDPRSWPVPHANLASLLLDHPEGYDSSSSGRTKSLGLSITGLAAAGIPPHAVPLPDGGSRDLVAELLEEYQGEKFKGAVIDNIWALFGLNAARYEGPEISSTITYLRAVQGPDGSISWNGLPIYADVDTTAWGIAAVAPHAGTSAQADRFLASATNYLQDQQIENGDRAACWPNFDGEPRPESTSTAINALVALGIDPTAWAAGETHPVDCLLRFFDDSKGFGSSALQVIPALAWAPFGSLEGPRKSHMIEAWAPIEESSEIPIPDGFLYLDNGKSNEPSVVPTSRGIHEYHGFTWFEGNPRPVVAKLIVPPIPEPPDVALPTQMYRGEDLWVDATANDEWTDRISIEFPDEHGVETALGAFRPAKPGDLDVLVFAENRFGEQSDPTIGTVTVLNQAPTISIQGPDSAPRSKPVRFQAVTDDPEQDPVTVHWRVDGETLHEGHAVELDPRPPGRIRVVAEATDVYGQTAIADVLLDWRDTPPRIMGAVPSTARPGPVKLQAFVGDPDEDPFTVEWSSDDQPLGTGEWINHEFKEGTHQLTVSVRSEYNETTFNHTIRVRPGILPVTLTWDTQGLSIDADVPLIRAGGVTGVPPITIWDVEPGDMIGIEALHNDTVVATAEAVVPPRPETPSLQEDDSRRPKDLWVTNVTTSPGSSSTSDETPHARSAPIMPGLFTVLVALLSLRVLSRTRRKESE